MTVFAKDITEKIKQDNQLKESNYKMQTILNSTNEGIYGVDVDGNCTFVNQALLEMLGYDDENEFIGKNMHAMIHYQHEDGSPFKKEACDVETAAILGETGVIGEGILWHKNKTMLHVEFSSNPLIDENKVIGAVVTVRDETEKN